MDKQIIFGHLLSLIFGSMIYIAFRDDSLLMFNWFSALSLDIPIEIIRGAALSIKSDLPNWFLFSLPDGLWVFSYLSLTLWLWSNRITKHNVVWLFLVPIIAIFSEIGQALQIVSGTFDFTDLFFYSCGAILPFIFFTNFITFKND
jgi:glycopeptide antibiotics resistance protein